TLGRSNVSQVLAASLSSPASDSTTPLPPARRHLLYVGCRPVSLLASNHLSATCQSFGAGRCFKKSPIGARDTFAQPDPRHPAEGANLVAVQQLARCAIGLSAIVDN